MDTNNLITACQTLAELQAKATPGPWAWQLFGKQYCLTGQWGMRPIVLSVMEGKLTSLVDGFLKPFCPNHPDAELIAAASAAPFAELAEALGSLDKERDALRAELEEKSYKLQRALGDLESLPWASSKELGAEIKHLRADIEQMDLDNDRLTLKVMELVNQRNSLQAQLDAAKATISNIETGMGLRIAAAEAQLATRTDGILPCPVCENPPRKWMCKRCGLSGPDNDPTGAGWNAMVAEMEKQG